MNKGIFITFEGIEASGKSTQADMLYRYLKERGYNTIITREPGGTLLGKKIRDILLSPTDESFPEIAEILLYEADRNIHIQNVIKPNLERGFIVISDRFYDSTVAYQHFGRGLPLDTVDFLNSIASQGIKPDITFLLDIEVETAFERLKNKGRMDRIESQGIDFHKRVREGFLSIAKANSDRFIVLDANRPIQHIFSSVVSVLFERFDIK